MAKATVQLQLKKKQEKNPITLTKKKIIALSNSELQ